MSQPMRILVSLVLGLGIGFAAAEWDGETATAVAVYAEPIGRLWLSALQMTIVPLVVSLLVTGVARTAEAARANRLAARAIILFMVVLWLSATTSALLTPALLGLWPLPPASADALRGALSLAAPAGEVPGFADFLQSIVPTNPVNAAAEDAMLPLVVFTLVFAFALTRLPEEPRATLTGFFRAVTDVMLVMMNWVLWLGPIGVFALAYVVGARAGTAAFGALLHYVTIVSAVGIVVWLAAWPLARLGAGIGIVRFSRAVAPAQAIAVSTQSSLASLPVMLRSAENLGVPVAASGMVLPLAVAIFRATGPAMNLAVAIYIAHWFGIELGAWQIAAGVAVAATTTLGSVSLPGQVSFVASIAPICVAMGVPIEPLAILIAVETIPDIFRTVGNVTMDVAATATAAKRSGFKEADAASAEDRMLAG